MSVSGPNFAESCGELIFRVLRGPPLKLALSHSAEPGVKIAVLPPPPLLGEKWLLSGMISLGIKIPSVCWVSSGSQSQPPAFPRLSSPGLTVLTL